MKVFITSLFLIFFNLTSAFSSSLENAFRNENEDYRSYMRGSSRSKFRLRKTPLNSAIKYSEETLPKVVEWKSEESLQERFAAARDLRFLKSASSGEFPRRISWLFPDDGCFARAALFNRNFFRMFVPIPQKVFVFGNLSVETPYSPRGRVSWWYHTASVIEVKNTKYVLDPAIEFNRPLTLREWLERMGNPDKMEIAFCNSGAYSPNSDCSSENNGLEVQALSTQKLYLDLEWNRIKTLGLDPEMVLGDSPPWF